MEDGKYVWTVAPTRFLISEYERYEMLYNSRHVNYKNRNMRQDIYKTIATAINENMDTNTCTVEAVKKKINGLRSQYLAEKLKVSNSFRSGVGAGEIYRPTVYWFPMLHFLDGSTNADESISNLDNPSCSSSIPPWSTHMIESQIETIETEEIGELPSPSITLGQKNKRPLTDMVNKRGKPKDQNALLADASTTMLKLSKLVEEIPKNSLDTFGKYIVSELTDIESASNVLVMRATKRSLQRVLQKTWKLIDANILASGNEVPLPLKSYTFTADTLVISDDDDNEDEDEI